MTSDRAVLIVEVDDARRAELRRALAARSLYLFEVTDAFEAMAAIGRAEFGAVVAGEGKRQLSLRGLCQLARRSHPGVHLFVVKKPETDERELRARIGVPVEVRSLEDPIAALAHDVAAALQGRPLEPSGPTAAYRQAAPDVELDVSFDVDEVDLEPTVVTAAAVDHEPHDPLARAPAAKPAAPAPVDLGDTLVDLHPLDPALVQDLGDGAGGEDLVESAWAEPPPKELDPFARAPNTVPDGPNDVTPHDVAPGAPTVPVPAPVLLVEEHPLFEGLLEPGAGAKLLMGVFSQELTGRLEVVGGKAEGRLFFYRGEPVSASHPVGDMGLLGRLSHKGLVDVERVGSMPPEGELLSTLVATGQLSGEAMHEFMRGYVRERVLDVTLQERGGYRFIEDQSFLEATPLLKVNPFGLIVEARRRQTPPAQLLEASRTTAERYLEPLPGLALAADKLLSFTRNVNAYEAIGGGARVRDFLARMGLDDFMGTLIVLALEDARLVRLVDALEADETKENRIPLAKTPSTQELAPIQLPDSDVQEDEEELPGAQEVREEIFALYMRLKPLTRPIQVLGVSLDDDLDTIHQAYERIMRDLDPRRIPEGSARNLLVSRVEELRGKVTNAFQALRLQLDGGARMRPSRDDTNPW